MKIKPNSMRSGRKRTSSKMQWDAMCKQEASWWRELLPCQRSLLSLSHPRSLLKRESVFPSLSYEGTGEGRFLSTVYSVSPAANWWQGWQTMRHSHLILQYLIEERFHQKAREDYSFITASYLASLEGKRIDRAFNEMGEFCSETK